MGEAIITGELMATGEAEVKTVQKTRDFAIVASRDRRVLHPLLGKSLGYGGYLLSVWLQ